MKIGQIALVLWILTVGVIGYFFVQGVTSKSTDQRRAVQLNAAQKDMVLAEMRTILSAVNGILVGLSTNDLPAVSKAAKSAGMVMAVDGDPGLIGQLPMEFKNLGMSLHADFDKLSADVDAGFTTGQVIKSLSEITGKCVSCHAVYRLSSDKSK